MSNPDYTNEKGVKWWVHPELTKLANEPDVNGNKLSVTGYFIQETDGGKAFVLVNSDSEIIEFEETYGSMARRIASRKESQKHIKNYFLPPFFNKSE